MLLGVVRLGGTLLVVMLHFTTPPIMTLNLMILSADAECCYLDCHICRALKLIPFSLISFFWPTCLLSVTFTSVMLGVVMLAVIMLSVFILSVVASLYEVLKVEGNLKGFDQLSLFLPHIKITLHVRFPALNASSTLRFLKSSSKSLLVFLLNWKSFNGKLTLNFWNNKWFSLKNLSLQ